MVKHKSKYSCKSTIYFNLDSETIKDNCKLPSVTTKHITPTILDGGNEIILANGTNDKHIICTINNDIPINIPSDPYVLVNRNALCNCGIEMENHFLLESLAACQDVNSKLVMYFMVNTAFVNYLDQFLNLTETLEFPIIKNKTTFEQALPISLNISEFNSNLLTASSNLKDLIHQFTCKKAIFDLKEGHDNMALITNKKLFSGNYVIDVLLFIAAIISLLVTT